MRKLIWILIALTGVVLIIYFWKNSTKCVQIELRQLSLEGDVQSLIGFSETKNDLLYTGLRFEKDTAYFSIFGERSGLISDAFSFGDFLNDSAMLVFDQSQNPFLYKPSKNQFDSIHGSVNFKGLEMSDVKISTLKEKHGVFVNNGDSLIFWDLEKDSTHTIFSLWDLPDENELIKSFDVYGNRALISVRQTCSEECDYSIFLVDIEDGSVKHITSVNGLDHSGKFAPMVNFLDDNQYVICYSSDGVHLLLKSVDGNREREFCLGNSLEVLSIEAIPEKVYLTIINEQIRKSMASENGLKNLYSGMSVVTVDLPKSK